MARKQLGAAPSQPTDAVPKSYVDTAVGAKVTNVSNVTGIWRGTQAAYALLTPDPAVMYFITEA